MSRRLPLRTAAVVLVLLLSGTAGALASSACGAAVRAPVARTAEGLEDLQLAAAASPRDASARPSTISWERCWSAPPSPQRSGLRSGGSVDLVGLPKAPACRRSATGCRAPPAAG